MIVSRLRQSRVSTASFSVVTEYIKMIALFLLGARPPPPRFLCVLLGGAPPSPAVTSQLSLLLLYSFSSLGSCLPLPHTSKFQYAPIFYPFLIICILFPMFWQSGACMHVQCQPITRGSAPAGRISGGSPWLSPVVSAFAHRPNIR